MRLRAIWALGLTVALSHVGSGQAVVLPDVNNLAHQMAERVRHLGEDIASDLAQTPSGRHLIQDTQELAQAVDEFHETLHDNRDPARARQAFAGIDGTWQHLRAQLTRPGVSSPAVDRAAGHVDQLAEQIRQALGLNAPPPGFYGTGPAPSGIAETQRLAHALAARAEALAAAIQADLAGDPNGAALAQDAARLAQQADAFHDSIDANQPLGVVAQAFGPVDALADRLERFLTSNPVPPRVQAAWQAFASVEVLIHQNLGLPSPQPAIAISLTPPAGGGPSPIVGLADQLVEQTRAFIQVFGPTAAGVPEGGLFLADAQRLLDAAANFRQNAVQGLNPGQLAYEFRDVDACWQRLARRTNRLARGRTGPNIGQVARIGETCEQLHRALGMPGYPAAFGVPR